MMLNRVKVLAPMCRSNFSGLSFAKPAISLSNYEAKTSDYFASAVSLTNESLLKKDNLYETALLDLKDGKLHYASIDEYMSTISRNSRNFQNTTKISSLETVELSKILSTKSLTKTGNSIVCVIGDASACRQISSNNTEIHGEVYEINAQKYGANLDNGLVAAVQNSIQSKNKDKKLMKVLQNNLLSGFSALKKNVTNYIETFDLELAPIARNIAKLNQTTNNATKYSHVHELAAYLTQKHKKVTIKISNAEQLFQTEGAADVLQLIHSLATNTNYSSKINFILSSQDTNLLQRLNSLRTFNLSSSAVGTLSSHVVHTAELSPREVVAILQDKLSVGPRLSVALSNVYGGHLGDILRVLEQLDLKRSDFTVEDTVSLAVYDALYETLFDSGLEGEDLASVEGALRQLVTAGFVPVASPNSLVAQVLTSHRLAVLVSKQDTVVNLDSSLWSDLSTNPNRLHYALLPVKQSLRLVIHDYLLDCEKLHSVGTTPMKQIAEVSVAAPVVTPPTVVETVVAVVESISTVVEASTPIVPVSSHVSVSPAVDSIEVDGLEGRVSRDQLKIWATNGELSSLTVPQLKTICGFLGVGAGGAKAAIVKRIISTVV